MMFAIFEYSLAKDEACDLILGMVDCNETKIVTKNHMWTEREWSTQGHMLFFLFFFSFSFPVISRGNEAIDDSMKN